jgi:hypothetical protein
VLLRDSFCFEEISQGINIRNESAVPILVVLSQLLPLHWTRVEPNETKQQKSQSIATTTLVLGFFAGIAPERHNKL